MSQVERIIVPNDSQDPKAFQLAIACAHDICLNSNGAINDVVLLAHHMNNFKHTTLAAALGDTAKEVAKGNVIKLAPSVSLTGGTKRTIGNLPRKAVVVACYADEQLMDHADSLTRLGGIVAVPDLPDGIAVWVKTWNPHLPGQEAGAAQTLINDPILEKALATITGGINLGNSALNPRDKQYVEDTLKILRARGHKATGDDIKAWAVFHKWQPATANDLRLLAQKILNQASKPAMGKIVNWEQRYENWK